MAISTIKRQNLKVGLYVSFILILQTKYAIASSENDLTKNDIFANTPRNVTAIEGSTVILPCNLRVDGIAKWKRDGMPIIIQPDDPRIIYNNKADGDFSLRITNLTKSDAGSYECRAFLSNYELPDLSITTELSVVVADLLSPPELGDDFIRYISLADMQLACETDTDSVAVQGSLQHTQVTRDESSKDSIKADWLKTLFKINSGTTFSCEISDPYQDMSPRFTLIIKVLFPSKLILRVKFGLAESHDVECLSTTKNDQMLFICYRTHKELQPIPTLSFGCKLLSGVESLSGGKNVFCHIRSAANHEDLGYSFQLLSKPNLPQSTVPDDVNLGVFTFKPDVQPGLLVWEKLKRPVESTTSPAVVIKENGANCTNQTTNVIVQVTVDHRTHQIPLKVPTSIGSGPGYIRNCGLFQTTCYLWFWNDKVFNVIHDGMVLMNLCKVYTLDVKVTVHDVKTFEDANKCFRMNTPQSAESVLVQFTKIPTIYPFVILVCLLCVTMTMMLYVGRKLFLLLTENYKKRGSDSERSITGKRTSRVYVRFLNSDEVPTTKKLTVI